MVELNKTEARQGQPVRRMRYVLAISVAAVVVLFVILLLSWV